MEKVADLLEVVGFGLVAAGVVVLAGPGWGLVAGGVLLSVLAYGWDRR